MFGAGTCESTMWCVGGNGGGDVGGGSGDYDDDNS